MGLNVVRMIPGSGRFAHPLLGGGGLGLVASIVFIMMLAVLAVLLVIAMTRKPKPVSAPPGAVDAAVEIARGRLARGEIDPEHYSAIVSALNGTYLTDAAPPSS